MRRLENEGLVIADRVSFRETRNGDILERVNVEGSIFCVSDLVIVVDKWLALHRDENRRDLVKGYSYSYHAYIRGSRQPVVRYDSTHGPIHRHDFEPPSGIETITDVDLLDLPTLGDFIRDAIDLRAKWP